MKTVIRRGAWLFAAAMAVSVCAPAFGQAMRAAEQEVVGAQINMLESDGDKAMLVAPSPLLLADIYAGRAAPAATQLAADFPEATPVVIADFLRVAGVPAAVQATGAAGRRTIRWRMADEATLDALLKTGAPEEALQALRARVPDAISLLRVSRVGLDEAVGQAFLFVSARPGSPAASGRLVLMEKRAGTWQLLRSMRTGGG